MSSKFRYNGGRFLAGIMALLLGLPTVWAREIRSGNSSGFYPGRVLDEIARHKYNRRQIERAVQEGRMELSTTGPLALDVGDVAVIQDDGTLITGGYAPFDLRGRSLRFLPRAQGGFDLSMDSTGIDTSYSTAVTLGDDDSRQYSLPFGFIFYGISHHSIYLNSDGNLTFGSGDNASSERSLSRFRTGAPRIAGFFTDLNPEQGGKIYADISAQRAMFTWIQVPEFDANNANTFQVVLYPGGEIRISFDAAMNAQAGIVGISPGSVTTEITLVNFNVELPRSVLSGAIAEQFSTTVIPEIDTAALAQTFYRNHPDDFDNLMVFSVPFVFMDNTCAYYLQLKNEIRGLGDMFGDGGTDDLFDYSDEWGSRSRLQGFLNMGMLSRYPSDPQAIDSCPGTISEFSTLDVMAHESGHRWGAFLLLNQPGVSPYALTDRYGHWGFFVHTQASELDGNDIRDNGNGTFTTVDVTQRYSPLDQYLMGLRPGTNEMVPPFFYVPDPVGAGVNPDSKPIRGVTFRGTRRDVTINDVIAANGPRIPDAAHSPKKFRQAFILLIAKNATPNPADLDKIERIRSSWVQFFKTATDNLGEVDTSLKSTAQPATFHIPFSEGDSTRYTGIALANRDTVPASVTATIYASGGTLLNLPGITNPTTLTLAGGEQRALLDAQVFNFALTADRKGWVKVASSSDRVTCFYLSGDLDQNYLDGAAADEKTYSEMFFTRAYEGPGALFGQDARTQISLANPGNVAVSATLQYLNSSGSVNASVTKSIPAQGRLAESLRELFPALPLPLVSGYVRVTASAPLSGVEMVRFGDTLFTLPAQPRLSAAKLYSAQFASGGAGVYPAPYFTNIKLVNYGETSAQVRIRLVAEGGTLLQVSGVTNPLERTLTARSELSGKASILFGFPQEGTDPIAHVGSVIVEVLSGSVVGDVLFGDALEGRTVAGLPLESRLFNSMVFSQVAEGASGSVNYFTGIAALNPSDKGVELVIRVYDESGRLTGINWGEPLPARQRFSKTLSQLVPPAAGQQRGYIMVEVLGSTGVAIFELFGDTELKRFLSAVPPQAYNIAP